MAEDLKSRNNAGFKNMYLRRLRQYIGVALYDLPMVMLPAMRPSNLESGSLPWTRMHNQGEHLSFSKKVKGVRCNWQGGSDLYLSKVLPICGRWLYRRAFRDFPIEFQQNLKGKGVH